MAISSYFAKVSVATDMAALKKVDLYLRQIERRMQDFQKRAMTTNGAFNLRFNIDERALVRNLGNALDRAANKVTVDLRNFHINQAALGSALRRAAMGTAVGINVRQANYPLSQGVQQVPAQSRDYGRQNYLHAGGAAGALARYGMGSLPLIGGVYGMGALNRANQELVSTEIASGAIFGENAEKAKAWLEKHSDYVGYDYLSTMPIFSSFMASSMPLMGYEQSQDVFSSLTEFGRTRGTDDVGMKRAMVAIQQMAAKGQVMQEELKLQLSEAKGFGESRAVFAEANQIRKGGTKTGAEAAKELIKDMERGEVMSADILPIVAKLFKELAAGGIEAARKSSTAQEMRFRNERTRQLRVFSESGGEKGFANFWSIAAELMKGMEPIVKGLAGAFETLSRYMQPPVYLFGEFTSVLRELGSVMGATEGQMMTYAMIGGLMMTKWGRVGLVFNELFLVLEDISYGMRGYDSYTKDFMDWANMTSPLEKGLFGVSAALLAIAGALKAVSVASSLPGINDMFGKPGKGGNGGKGGIGGGGWAGRLAGLLAIGGVAGGGYYIGNELRKGGDPSISVQEGENLKNASSNAFMGFMFGGWLGAAAGGIYSLTNPTWGNNLSIDPLTGAKMVPSQDNSSLTMALLQHRAAKSGQKVINVTFENGAFNIQTQAMTSDELMKELRPSVERMFSHAIDDALVTFPQTE